MLDIEGLRKLKADLPLKLKVWTKERKGKVVLQARLGDFLGHLDSCSIPTTFRVTSSGDSFTFAYSVPDKEAGEQEAEQVQKVQEELPVTADTAPVETEATSAAEAVPFAADEGLVTKNDEEASVCIPALDGQWVTFVNKLTGTRFSLPAHTQAEKEARWRGPGAWTSEDDLLDEEWVTFVNKSTGATFRLPAQTSQGEFIPSVRETTDDEHSQAEKAVTNVEVKQEGPLQQKEEDTNKHDKEVAVIVQSIIKEQVKVILETRLEDEGKVEKTKNKIQTEENEELNKDVFGNAREDAAEECVEEAVLSSTLPQDTKVKDAVTDNVTEQDNENKSDKKKQWKKTRKAEADVGLLRGVMRVTGQDPDASTETWTVACSRNKRTNKRRALIPVNEVKDNVMPPPPKEKSLHPVNVEVQVKPAAPNKATPAPRRNTRRAQKAPQNSVRDSWKQQVVDIVVPVAPHMRRCIVGPRGAILKQVQQEFVGVRVTVPPPLDAVTDTVRVRGPPRQVAETVTRLKALLHEGELIEERLAVTPQQRCHVVGPAGVTLKKLLREYPDVAVTVPPQKDRESCTVALKGPRRQVTGATTTLNTYFQAALIAHRSANPNTNRPAHLNTHHPACSPIHRPTHPTHQH